MVGGHLIPFVLVGGVKVPHEVGDERDRDDNDVSRVRAVQEAAIDRKEKRRGRDVT